MFKYAGDLIWKETAFGLEQVPVGFHRENQGGLGARNRRRARRAMAFSPPLFGMGGWPPVFSSGPYGFPAAPPVFPSVGQATAPVVFPPAPPPEVAVSKAPPAEPAPDQQWKSAAPAADKAWGGKWPAWQKKQQEKDWEADEPQWKKPKKQVPLQTYKETDEAFKQEKTARLLCITQQLLLAGRLTKNTNVHWCSHCRQKMYVGGDMCCTPGCIWPLHLANVLPPVVPTITAALQPNLKVENDDNESQA